MPGEVTERVVEATWASDVQTWANEWQDVVQVIVAVGTLVAVTVAVLGFWFEKRRADTAEQDKQNERARREAIEAAAAREAIERQARRVFVEVAPDVQRFAAAQDDNTGDGAVLRVVVYNRSDLPIYRVCRDTGEGATAECVLPDTTIRLDDLWVTDPGEMQRLTQGHRPEVGVRFVDAAERRWRIGSHGSLDELPDTRQTD